MLRFSDSTCRPSIAVFLLGFSIVFVSCSEEGPTDPVVEDDSAELVLLASLYNDLPDPDECDPGQLVDAERQNVLQYVNQVRAAHGLPTVGYASEHDDEVTASALITAANDLLSHQPTSDLKCWSDAGYRGSNAGNLGWAARFDQESEMAFSTKYMVDLWWNDDGEPSVGHRRWMLNPFLTSIAFGRVDRPMTESESAVTATTLWVINEDEADISTLPIDFVAYPFEITPRRRFNSQAELSFSALVDRTDFWANQDVDYSSATIEVTDPSGERIAVNNIRRLNDGAGLPNALVWQSPIEQGTRYDVTIGNVRWEGKVKGYSYWFEVE